MALYKEIKIPLKYIYDSERFLLLDISELFEYINGRKTGNQIGYRFMLVDASSYDKFIAKVLNLEPQVTREMLTASREKMFVRMIDAFAKPYVDKNGRLAYSITAKDVEIVRKSAISAAERS